MSDPAHQLQLWVKGRYFSVMKQKRQCKVSLFVAQWREKPHLNKMKSNRKTYLWLNVCGHLQVLFGTGTPGAQSCDRRRHMNINDHMMWILRCPHTFGHIVQDFDWFHRFLDYFLRYVFDLDFHSKHKCCGFSFPVAPSQDLKRTNVQVFTARKCSVTANMSETSSLHRAWSSSVAHGSAASDFSGVHLL